MADVELVEDDHTAGPLDEAAAPAPVRTPHDLRIRRLRRVAVAGLAVLVTGLVVTQQVMDAREEERLTRYADLDGVLAPVRPDAREVWSIQNESDRALSPWAVPSLGGDLLLGGTVDRDGSVTLTAIDPDTGTDVWTVGVELAWEPGLAEYPGSVGCQAPPAPASPSAAPSATVSCTVAVPQKLVGLVADDGSSSEYAIGQSALLLVDTATGEVRQRVDVPSGTRLSSVPGGYVTATPDVAVDPTWTSPADVPDASVSVARYDWGSSTPRWTFRTPPVANALDQDWLFGDARQVAVRAGGTLWLLHADDGTLLGSLTSPDDTGTSAEMLPGGGVLTSSYDEAGPSSLMLTSDGTVVDLPGLLSVTRIVDDGSAADVLLLSELTANRETGALVAVDARTGERRWTSTASARWSAMVLGGVVYASAGRELSAVDAHDGAVLWTRAVESSDGQLYTDGAAALLFGQGQVDAYDLRDGSTLWASLVVRTDDAVSLWPITGGPTASATAAPARDKDSRSTMVGRHLGVISPTGDLSVLG